MDQPSYPSIPSLPKSGDELFSSQSTLAKFDLRSFWQWSASDLISNATRGVLAEYIVAQALGIATGVRTEWDAYDLRLENGPSIEVKSASYLQSWHQKQLSTIIFGIAPTRALIPKTGDYDPEVKRQAKLYVFCLLETKDQSELDPMDLDQWVFYVLSTKVLNKHSLRGCVRRLRGGLRRVQGLRGEPALPSAP